MMQCERKTNDKSTLACNTNYSTCHIYGYYYIMQIQWINAKSLNAYWRHGHNDDKICVTYSIYKMAITCLHVCFRIFILKIIYLVNFLILFFLTSSGKFNLIILIKKIYLHMNINNNKDASGLLDYYLSCSYSNFKDPIKIWFFFIKS